MQYDINRPWLSLDEWQKEYIKTEKNCFLLCGRQSGKTTAMSIKIIESALKEQEKCDYLVIALTERQAYNLFFKALTYAETRYPRNIKRGRDKPTMHEMTIKNAQGAEVCIMCYAAGLTGWNLHGYTVKKLFVDEAAPMSREVFISVSPMLSVTGGTMDLASTPRGKEGYFYECSLKDNFEKFYVSAEDCLRHDKEFLNSERKTMSEMEFAQEYLAKFLDDLKRVFSDELIKKACVLHRPDGIQKKDYVVGIDLARLGADFSTFEILDCSDDEHVRQVESIITKKKLTTETEDKILELNRHYDFMNRDSIGIDAGSGTLGVSVLDHCLREDSLKRKIVAINNRARPYDKDDTARAKLLQEDLYNNLVAMMERGTLQLLNDFDVIDSLKSVQYEWIVRTNQKSRVRYFGRNTHVAEGLTRAAWLAKDKRLNIWCYY